MSRFVRMFAGLLMVSSLSGCCLLGHHGGYAPYGGGGGYGGGGYGGGCGCGPQANGYPSAMYAPGIQQTAFTQPQVGGYYPAMAAVPQDVLATY